MADNACADETLPDFSTVARVTRRAWIAAGGLLLAAGGLALPERPEEAAAREGAFGGRLGGRRGKNRRGRDNAKRRGRGNNKDKDANNGHGKGKAPGDFNNAGMTVRNAGLDQPRPPDSDFYLEQFSVTFFAQRYRAGDQWDPPFIIQDPVTVDLVHAPETTVTPDFHRCGALIQHPFLVDGDLYVDVWDLPLWFPQGRVLQGKNLDPPHNNLGTEVLSQRIFIGGALFRGHVNVRADGTGDTLVFKLSRLDDGKNRLRFKFDVY